MMKRTRTFWERWPNACTHCGGWGLHSHVETHGFTHGPYETFTYSCEALGPRTCHRCGEDGLDEESRGPCSMCGWDYDDGAVASDIEPLYDQYDFPEGEP